MVLRPLDICRQKINFSLSLMPNTKVTSEEIMDVKVKCKALNLQEKNGRKPCGLKSRHKVLRLDAKDEIPKSKIWQTEPFSFSSVTQLCPTLCNPMDCSIPSQDPSRSQLGSTSIISYNRGHCYQETSKNYERE